MAPRRYRLARGQQRATRHGKGGFDGIAGLLKSATYRQHEIVSSSNPTLSAILANAIQITRLVRIAGADPRRARAGAGLRPVAVRRVVQGGSDGHRRLSALVRQRLEEVPLRAAVGHSAHAGGGCTSRPSWYPALRDQFVADNAPSCPIAGHVTLTSPIIALDDLDLIVPQGELIGDHVTPIDHGYIGVRTLRLTAEERAVADYVPIRTPADAQVLAISSLGSPTSLSILLAYGCDTYTTLMVVNRLAGALAVYQNDVLSKGYVTPKKLRVLAGTVIGEQRDNPLDFMVEDGASWLSGYVAPFSYAEGEAWKPFVVNPWPYFSPDLQALYESRMQRTYEPRWGKIDLDVRGAAAGNWFLDGTVGYSGRPLSDFQGRTPLTGGQVPGKNFGSWSHLAIVPHAVQPRWWMFSIGWWQNPAGDSVQLVIDLRPGQPAPAELTSDSGVVVYLLRNWSFSSTNPPGIFAPQPIGYDIVPYFLRGIVALRVNEDESLSIEIVPSMNGEMPMFTEFTSNSRVYRR